MTNELLKQSVSNQFLVEKALPILSTINNLPTFFPMASLTPATIRAQIFKSENRFNSKGGLIAGNGLEEFGAIIRRKGTRSVLIDVSRYGAWLSGKEIP